MEETKNISKETEKTFTQKEVENIIQQVNLQAKTQLESIYKENQLLREQIVYKRLDYLFKVVENRQAFSDEFVGKCTDEIQNGLTIIEPSEEELNNENK